MNEIERAMTGKGQVFKKAKAEKDGTHGSGAAKMRAGFKLKKALRNTQKKK